MTSVGTASVDLVGDVSKFAAQVSRDVKAALAGLKVEPITLKGDVAGFQRSIETAAKDVREFSGSAEKDLSGVSSAAAVTGSRISESFEGAALTGKTAMAGLTASAETSLAGLALKLGPIALIGTILTKGFSRLTTIEDATRKLEFLGSTADEAAEISREANQSVIKTYFGLDEAVKVAAASVASGVKPGADLARELQLVADTAALTGIPLEDMGRIFNQVAAGNALFTDQINQLKDRGFPIIQNLAKELKVPEAQVKKLAETGKITFKQFEDAMDSTKGAAKDLGDTTTGSFKNVGAAVGRLGQAILDPAFKEFGPILQNITKFLEEHRKAVELVIGAYVIYQAVALLAAAASFILAAAEGLVAAITFILETPFLLVILIIGLFALALFIAWQKSETFRNVVTAVFEAVKVGAENLWKALQNAFTFIVNAVTNTKNGIVNGFNAVVDFFKKLPGRISSAIGNLGDLLFNKGKDLINGLKRGIESAIDGVKKAFSNLFGWIGDHLPGSPIKIGPLSGSNQPIYGGEKIGMQLAEGLRNSIPAVAAASRQVTGAIGGQVGGFGTPAFSGGPALAAGAGMGGQSVTFSSGAVSVTFTGAVPTPEQAAQAGQAVGAGIATALARRDLRVAIRTV